MSKVYRIRVDDDDTVHIAQDEEPFVTVGATLIKIIKGILADTLNVALPPKSAIDWKEQARKLHHILDNVLFRFLEVPVTNSKGVVCDIFSTAIIGDELLYFKRQVNDVLDLLKQSDEEEKK